MIRFHDRDDRVRLDIPGRFRTVTLAAWVNLKGLENEFNGLLLTDGWKARIGQFHWQLTRSGRIDFGINLGPRIRLHSLPLAPAGGYRRFRPLATPRRGL